MARGRPRLAATTPLPTNGSIKRRVERGTSSRIAATSRVLPPAHLRKARCTDPRISLVGSAVNGNLDKAGSISRDAKGEGPGQLPQKGAKRFGVAAKISRAPIG